MFVTAKAHPGVLNRARSWRPVSTVDVPVVVAAPGAYPFGWVRRGGWVGARGRPGRWRTLVVALVTLGAYATVSSQEPHPQARFGLVDIDAYPRLTGITACANPLVPKPGVAAFRAMILSQVGGTDDG